MSATSSAQLPFPDLNGETPSGSFDFYENKGQIIDDLGALRPDVKYYSQNAAPRIYFGDDTVHFTAFKPGQNGDPDSSFRIDMSFLCTHDQSGQCGDIQVYERGTDILNYYLPHCGNGITDVEGWSRLVYENAFPFTDVHFTSNNMGLKNYIQFRPGSDPTLLKLKFTGQDSIVAVANSLALFLASGVTTFPDATAYQVDTANNIVPLSWLPMWNINSNNEVTLTMGSYDPTLDLVITIGAPAARTTANGNNDWATFYGDYGKFKEGGHIATDVDGGFYHLMYSAGGVLLPLPGAYQPATILGNDLFITAFRNDLGRQWATYFGGESDDEGYAIALSSISPSDGGNLYVAGKTSSNNFPITGGTSIPTWQQLQKGDLEDGFLTCFKSGSGHLVYGTFFGGKYNEAINSIIINHQAQKLYFVGQTLGGIGTNPINCTPGTGNLPICYGRTEYGQNIYQGNSDATMGEFDISNGDLDLKYCSLLGGDGNDNAFSISYSKATGIDRILITGSTEATAAVSPTSLPTILAPTGGTFVMANPGSGAYFYDLNSNGTTYLLELNAQHGIEWSTFFQGSDITKPTYLANNNSGDLYLTGMTSGNIPITSTSNSYQLNSYQGLKDAYFAKFDKTLRGLIWSTYYGGVGDDYCNGLAIDQNDDVYFIGATNLIFPTPFPGIGGIPTLSAAGRYYQPLNSIVATSQSQNFNVFGVDDGWIAQFRSDNTRKWATHFGGEGSYNILAGYPSAFDDLQSVAVTSGSNPILYVCGSTLTTQTPNVFQPFPAYHDASFNYHNDHIIARFAKVGNTKVPTVSPIGEKLNIFPNPSYGIYNIENPPSMNFASELKITITDLMGNMILEKSVYITTSRQFKIDISSVASGCYFITVSTENIKIINKLIKL